MEKNKQLGLLTLQAKQGCSNRNWCDGKNVGAEKRMKEYFIGFPASKVSLNVRHAEYKGRNHDIRFFYRIKIRFVNSPPTLPSKLHINLPAGKFYYKVTANAKWFFLFGTFYVALILYALKAYRFYQTFLVESHVSKIQFLLLQQIIFKYWQ